MFLFIIRSLVYYTGNYFCFHKFNSFKPYIRSLFDVLRKEFDKCIIISHLDKITNMNNTVLRVKRDENGYSKII